MNIAGSSYSITTDTETDSLLLDNDDFRSNSASNSDEESGKQRTQIRYLNCKNDYICEWRFCGYQCKIWYEFVKHLETHSNQNDGTCSCEWAQCSFEIEDLSSFKFHVNYHAYYTRLILQGENVLSSCQLPKCSESVQYTIPEFDQDLNCEWASCSGQFDQITEFFDHVQHHVNVNEKPISQKRKCYWFGCNRDFKNRTRLHDHIRTHTKEKTVACPSCYHLFATKTRFFDHRKRQLSVDLHSYHCSQCAKSFASIRLLRNHMQKHINNYKCHLCDMTCPLPSTLSRHIRYKHMNSRLFKCCFCNQKFVTQYDLELHITTHISEKINKCDLCSFSCRCLVTLDKHYVDVHHQGTKKVYECHCCQRQFSRGDILTKHLVKMHDFKRASGHSRYRYIQSPNDGRYRLETVRFDSIEVTEKMVHEVKMKQQQYQQQNSKKDDQKDERFVIVQNQTDNDVNSTQFPVNFRVEIERAEDSVENVSSLIPLRDANCICNVDFRDCIMVILSAKFEFWDMPNRKQGSSSSKSRASVFERLGSKSETSEGHTNDSGTLTPVGLTPKVSKKSLAKGESDGTVVNWDPNNLENKDADYLEKRRRELQREIDLQTKIEMKQKKSVAVKKSKSRKSSSSSSSSSLSSSTSSCSSSDTTSPDSSPQNKKTTKKKFKLPVKKSTVKNSKAPIAKSTSKSNPKLKTIVKKTSSSTKGRNEDPGNHKSSASVNEKRSMTPRHIEEKERGRKLVRSSTYNEYRSRSPLNRSHQKSPMQRTTYSRSPTLSRRNMDLTPTSSRHRWQSAERSYSSRTRSRSAKEEEEWQRKLSIIERNLAINRMQEQLRNDSHLSRSERDAIMERERKAALARAQERQRERERLAKLREQSEKNIQFNKMLRRGEFKNKSVDRTSSSSRSRKSRSISNDKTKNTTPEPVVNSSRRNWNDDKNDSDDDEEDEYYLTSKSVEIDSNKNADDLLEPVAKKVDVPEETNSSDDNCAADLPLNIKEELVTVDSSQSDTKLDDSSAINDGNFSEISDDVDDDILNRDEPALNDDKKTQLKIKTEITESLSITENDDSLINLDFEEISDVEFDEETKTKGLGDILCVDWSTKNSEPESDKKQPQPQNSNGNNSSIKDCWQFGEIIKQTGFSKQLLGPDLNQQDYSSKCVGLSNDIAAFQTYQLEKQEIRKDLFSLSPGDGFKKALCAKQDLLIRRFLCDLSLHEPSQNPILINANKFRDLALDNYNKCCKNTFSFSLK